MKPQTPFFSEAPGERPENDVTVVYSDIDFDDFESQAAQLTPYDSKQTKLSPGRFRGRWTAAHLANEILIARWSVNCGMYHHVDCPEDWFGLSVPLGPPGAVANGVELDRNHLVMTGPGAELELDLAAEGGDFLVFSVERSAMEAIVGKDISPWSTPPLDRGRTSVVRASLTAGGLIESVLSLLRLCKQAPDSRLPRSLVTNLLAGTVGALEFELGLDADHGQSLCKSSYATFAEARESLAGMAEFDYAALAAAVGRCPRAIQMAFAEHARTTPYRYFRNLKLHRAREALLADPGAQATIGDIAAAHGFWNWSRFAQLYRRQFGETPSQTRVRLKGRLPLT